MANETRILVYVNGSHKIGLGHIVRMDVLARYLSTIGLTPVFLTTAETKGCEILEAAGWPVYASPEGDPFIPAAVLDAVDPQLIILDVLTTDARQLADLRKRTSARIVSFDDTSGGLHVADAVINSLVFSKGRYDPSTCRGALYEGPEYLIFSENLSATEPPHKIRENANRVLLAFGGTDDHAIAGRLVTALNLVDGPLYIRISRGPGTRPDETLEAAISASSHSVSIFQSPDNLFEKFVAADLVVCAGGMMLFELAALGVPSAAIAAEKHEVENITFGEAAGFTAYLGWQRDLDFTVAANRLRGLLQKPDERTRMAVAGKACVDGEGLQRCGAIIKRMAG